MSTLTWGDERRMTLEQYHAVHDALEARCKDLPEAAFKAAWARALKEIRLGSSAAMAITVGMQAAHCFRRTPGSAA